MKQQKNVAAMRHLGIRPGIFNRSDQLTLPKGVVAQMLGISRWTLNRHLADGTLPLEVRTVGKRSMILVRSIEKVLSL